MSKKIKRPLKKTQKKAIAMKLGKIAKLVISILVCELAGVVGSVFTVSAIPTWYAGLQKPSFAPPNWIFAPAWITLYILMGISLYLVWEKGSEKNKKAIGIFGVQLFLNAIWSIAFFGLKNPLYGLIVIVLLWVSILASMIAFWRIEKKAAWLLVPYIAWVSFAALLNYFIMVLNP